MRPARAIPVLRARHEASVHRGAEIPLAIARGRHAARPASVAGRGVAERGGLVAHGAHRVAALRTFGGLTAIAAPVALAVLRAIGGAARRTGGGLLGWHAGWDGRAGAVRGTVRRFDTRLASAPAGAVAADAIDTLTAEALPRPAAGLALRLLCGALHRAGIAVRVASAGHRGRAGNGAATRGVAGIGAARDGSRPGAVAGAITSLGAGEARGPATARSASGTARPTAALAGAVARAVVATALFGRRRAFGGAPRGPGLERRAGPICLTSLLQRTAVARLAARGTATDAVRAEARGALLARRAARAVRLLGRAGLVGRAIAARGTIAVHLAVLEATA